MNELKITKPSILSSNMLFLAFLLFSSIIMGRISYILGLFGIGDAEWVGYLTLFMNEALFVFGLPFLYLKATKRNILAVTRLNRGVNFGQFLLLLLILFTASGFINYLDAYWVDFLSLIGYKMQSLNFPQGNSYASLTMMLIVIAVTPAFCEEFLYRGVVLRGYENKGVVVAVVMSSLLFGLMHGTLEQLAYATALGAVMGCVVILTDSIWASIILHFLFNARSVVLQFAIARGYLSFPDIAMPSGYVRYVGFVVWLGLLVGSVSLMYVASRRKPKSYIKNSDRNGWGLVPLLLGTLIVFLGYVAAYKLAA